MIQSAKQANKVFLLLLAISLGLAGLDQLGLIQAQTTTVTSTRSILIVDTVADLANLTPIDGTLVRTKGYYTDGVGSALYRYHKTGRSGITANSVTYFNGGASDDYFELEAPNGVIDVTQAGAVGDGSTDDTDAIQSAFDSGLSIRFSRQHAVDDTVTLSSDDVEVIGTDAAELVGPENWYNKPLFLITGDRVSVCRLRVTETNGSPTNATKNQASNVGFEVRGKDCLIQDVTSTGFSFPFMCRDGSADGSKDGVTFERCLGKDGYSWGFELDSVQRASFIDCQSTNNGLDGFKAQNEYSRTCDGLRYVGCKSWLNGRRDIAAGGSENTNGNGFDLYHGGFQFRMSDCHAWDNIGSGLVLKGGGGGSIPQQGEGTVVNCTFRHARTNNLGAASHGVEIGTDNSVGHSILQFVGVTCSDNEGDGVFLSAGFGIHFSNCNILRNGQYGIKNYLASDVSFTGCNICRNGDYGAIVGYTNDASYKSKRVRFSGCNFNASFDPFADDESGGWDYSPERVVFTAEADDDTITSASHPFENGDRINVFTFTGTLPTGLTAGNLYWVVGSTANTFQLSTTKGGTPVNITADGSGTLYVTRDSEVGLRVYSDSADVTVEDCSFANFWSPSGTLILSGKRVAINQVRVKNSNRSAIQVTGGDSRISGSYFENIDFSGNVTTGVIYVSASASISDCTFSQSSLTASSRAIRFASTSTNASYRNIDTANISTYVVVDSGATFYGVASAVDGDTTPSVHNVDVLIFDNTSSETITNLDDGYNGKQIECHLDTNTTLNDSGGNFSFASSLSGSITGPASITLRLIDGVWTQTSSAIAF